MLLHCLPPHYFLPRGLRRAALTAARRDFTATATRLPRVAGLRRAIFFLRLAGCVRLAAGFVRLAGLRAAG